MEITSEYANQALKIHSEGKDKVGFLTVQKLVLSIYNESKTLIGFTVLTFKRGGSVKSGPTVFFEGFRNQGYGQLLRTSLHSYLLKRKVRKIYCTATVVNRDVVNYLLAAGYKVECQLTRQYGIFDELILGKILIPSRPSRLKNIATECRKKLESSKLISTGTPKKSDKGPLIAFIQRTFSKDFTKISKKVASSFVEDSFRNSDLAYEQKPKTILIGKLKNELIAACICLPKRGGSFKAVLLSDMDLPSLVFKELIFAVESIATKQRRSKIYYTVPEYRFDHIQNLRELKYSFEGVLIEPYSMNENVHIYSKILRKR